MKTFTIALFPELFAGAEKTLVESADFRVRAWTYPSGVKALALENARGRVIALPYQGQMIWAAEFDGCDLTMRSLFDQPRPTPTILGTYGCFMFHAGLLRNGCPAPDDDHPLHGEMPCAPMDSAWLDVGEDETGAYVRLGGLYEYVQGFGDHYHARPSVTLHAGSGLFDIGMQVTNLAGKPMDLMYMAHMNHAYVPGGRFVEPLGIAGMRVRQSVPAHVKPTPEWATYIAELSKDPSRLQALDTPELYDPEIVCFPQGVQADARGNAHFLLEHPTGAAFYTRYRPDQFSHATRWVLNNADHAVAAFVLPATCEPEGYLAEKAKGTVRSLASGETTSFSLTTGYLSAQERQRLGGQFDS
ncbi:aldose 1-epimerase family protein [Pseudomonas sp. RIT-PI-S]|uniref:aldose 1-epimerase family protein n=1 Tax=Pseudomonas sp. RIT-PI-S TaxID=3035295 RepID=UPI0021DA4203|nr:aldose 1-epimerase family protein [Pseudomonas sp. RIT-PI-S]